MNIYALRVSQGRALPAPCSVHLSLLGTAFIVREGVLDVRHFFLVLLIFTIPTYTGIDTKG
jgi:hypothetical protein